MQNDKIITVDLDDLGKLVHDGENIVLNPEAEEALLKLLALQQRVNDAVEAAKVRIESKALEYNPNFTSVRADRLKVGYQAFGGKYAVDELQIAKPDQLVITITAPKAHKLKHSDDVLIKVVSDELEFADDMIAIQRIAGQKGKLDPELFTAKTETKYSADSKAVDKKIKETGKIPTGIIEKERKKGIVLRNVEAMELPDSEF